jgi:hypothetical protein
MHTLQSVHGGGYAISGVQETASDWHSEKNQRSHPKRPCMEKQEGKNSIHLSGLHFRVVFDARSRMAL